MEMEVVMNIDLTDWSGLALALLAMYSTGITILFLAHWSSGRWFKKQYMKLRDTQNASFQKAIESQFGGEADWKKRSQVMSVPRKKPEWIGKLRRNEERVVIKADFRNKTKWEPGDSGPKGAA